MGRRVFIDADLRGQMFDASTEPDSHARETLFLRCQVDALTLAGDWRGTDYLSCQGPIDLTQAQVAASYWRGNTLTGVRFPPDIGFLHHEPVAKILDEGLSNVPAGVGKAIMERVPPWVLSDYTFASWDTAWDAMVKTIPGATKRRFITALRRAAQGYSSLLARIDRLEAVMVKGEGQLWTGSAPLSMTVTWPDGVAVAVDAEDLPPLPDPSRYTLARWIEAQADAQQPGPHYCFVEAIVPMWVTTLARPEAWLSRHRHGL